MAAPLVFDRLSALADPTRGRLLLALERQELTVREIQTALQLPQSTVSRHLKVLSELGLVSTREEGTSNWYRMPGRELDSGTRRLWGAVREEIAGSPAAQRDATRLQRVLAQRHLTSQRFFATAAGQWDRVRADLFGGAVEHAVIPALLDESWTVGDLGCGSGHLIEALAPFVRRIIGVDESAAMLKVARQRSRELANVELRQGALEDPPIASHELDVACCVLVLHHAPDPALVLASAHRTLKEGGKLLIVDMVPHDHTEYREQMGHQWLGFAEPELRGLLEQAGFGSIRSVLLSPDPKAKGPPLFSMTARRGARPN